MPQGVLLLYHNKFRYLVSKDHSAMFCLVPNSIESKNRERRAIGIFSPIANHQRGPVKLTIEEKKINYQTGKGETKTLILSNIMAKRSGF